MSEKRVSIEEALEYMERMASLVGYTEEDAVPEAELEDFSNEERTEEDYGTV